MSFITSLLSSFKFSFGKFKSFTNTNYDVGYDIESTLTQYEKNFYGTDSDLDSTDSDSYFSKRGEFMPCNLNHVIINVDVDKNHYLAMLV